MATISQATRAKRQRRQDFDKKLLAVVLVVITWVLLGAFVVQPRFSALKQAEDNKAYAQQQLDLLQSQIKQRPPVRIKVSKGQEQALKEALPARLDAAAAERFLRASAAAGGVQIQKLTPAQQPSAPKDAKRLSEQAFELSASGSLAQLGAFLGKLEGSVTLGADKGIVAGPDGRLVRVSAVKLEAKKGAAKTTLTARVQVYGLP